MERRGMRMKKPIHLTKLLLVLVFVFALFACEEENG